MNNLLLLGIGMQELLFIALLILLLFGGKKIPELMKGLGKGVKSFKDGVNGIEDSINNSSNLNDKSGTIEK
ncbi:twin-arginine translocase TatA/TatE family subunit [Bacteroides caecigallinarum]|nr:twin-arginine translocase TatA/TatE family subunit [Bacteroides caecigallinarum]